MQHDYKSPWWREHTDSRLDDLDIRDSSPWATLIGVIVFGALFIWMLHALVAAIVYETELRDGRYSQAERPQAFRKQSPTHEQMWQLDHLLTVQEVAKAGGSNGNR